jgi:hypothetical protein
VTVVTCEGGEDASPCECAVIIAVPGVAVVVTLTTAYSWPAGITTESGTEAMLVWEEERNTVKLLKLIVGRLFASSTETTSAGNVPLVGSLGGTIVSTTLLAGPGTFDVAAETGRNWTVDRNSATVRASIVVFLNFYCLRIGWV